MCIRDRFKTPLTVVLSSLQLLRRRLCRPGKDIADGVETVSYTHLLGEYIMSMNARIMNRPLVVEEKRLNFEKQEERDGKGTED